MIKPSDVNWILLGINLVMIVYAIAVLQNWLVVMLWAIGIVFNFYCGWTGTKRGT